MTPPLQNRFTPLSDGRPGLRSTLHCQISAPGSTLTQPQNAPVAGAVSGPPLPQGEGTGVRGYAPDSDPGTAPPNTLDFVSSDATLDRYNEIISPEGWDLSTYQKNPVFQNSHQYGDIIHTIGKALITEVRTGSPLPSDGRGVRGETSSSPLPSDGRGAAGEGSTSGSPLPSDGRGTRGEGSAPRSYLFQRIQFAVEANPIARIAYPLYAHGYLRAVSVGFIPLRWEDGAADSPCRRRYIQQQLLEVSAVSIPANPAALALAIKSGAIIKSDLQDTLELLRQVVPKTPPPLNPTLAPLARLLAQMVRHL